MISKAERQHLVALQKWSEECRAALQDMRGGPYGKVLDRLYGGTSSPEAVFDNVDWLLALIKREHHREGVRALRNAVAEYEGATK